MKSKIKFLITGSVLAGSLLMVSVASAQGPGRWTQPNGHTRAPSIVGTVSIVSGTTLTVQSKGFGRGATSTAITMYTVDASAAKVMKNNATSSVSNIATGDMVMVQGTVSGTNVAATMIRDGLASRNEKGQINGDRTMGGKNLGQRFASSTPQGNGQPIVGGSVTAINGSVVTITNKSNVIYTIDASNATVMKGGVSATLSGVSVGDNVLVQGTVNVTSVAASSIIDQGGSQNIPGSQPNTKRGPIGGFIGAIGGFFQHIFGF